MMAAAESASVGVTACGASWATTAATMTAILRRVSARTSRRISIK